jgi:hypothetical protein
MYEPLAVVTADRDQARWLLILEAESADGAAGADIGELNLVLADVDGGHRQRVASVFVAGSLGFAAAVTPKAVAPSSLLSALEMLPARAQGICDDRKARINSCVEIAFELREPAYLFVVSTRDHNVVETPCDRSLGLTEPGTRRYRMRVPPGTFAVDPADTGPDAGFYVLAVRERALAAQLRQALAEAPGSCGVTAGTAPAAWLDKLRQLLDRHGEQVAWRALHVAHDSTGIVAL